MTDFDDFCAPRSCYFAVFTGTHCKEEGSTQQCSHGDVDVGKGAFEDGK